MSIELKMAWRNIWRNGKRTGITVAAITVCTAVLIVSYALMQGMLEDMVRNVARRLQDDPRVRWFEVHAENHESIHNHAAFAQVAWTRPR